MTTVEIQDPATGQWRNVQGIRDVRATVGGDPLVERFLERQTVTAGPRVALSAWEQIKLQWALGAGLTLAKWVMRYGG